MSYDNFVDLSCFGWVVLIEDNCCSDRLHVDFDGYNYRQWDEEEEGRPLFGWESREQLQALDEQLHAFEHNQDVQETTERVADNANGPVDAEHKQLVA